MVDRTFKPPLLKSLTVLEWWEPKMPAARCDPAWRNKLLPTHPAPDPDCQCGYWGVKPDYLDQGEAWPQGIWSPKAVIDYGIAGWVEQWGVVDEYEKGYRSEHIKINSFIAFPLPWVEKNYTPPCHPRHWKALALDAYMLRAGQLADRFDVPLVLHDG